MWIFFSALERCTSFPSVTARLRFLLFRIPSFLVHSLYRRRRALRKLHFELSVYELVISLFIYLSIYFLIYLLVCLFGGEEEVEFPSGKTIFLPRRVGAIHLLSGKPSDKHFNQQFACVHLPDRLQQLMVILSSAITLRHHMQNWIFPPGSLLS